MEKHLSNIRNDYIRYAQCWEDADILVNALQPEAGSNILSIGSAGDNSFSLLTQNPAQVVAVDINNAQVQLIHLKKMAIQLFNRQKYLEFAGYCNSNRRDELIYEVFNQMNDEQLAYWNERIDILQKGIIHQGKFEHYFSHFRRFVMPLVHGKELVDELIKEKSEEEQLQFYMKWWNTPRWRWLFKIFFSRFIMGRFGRDPQFLKEVDEPVASFIFKRSELQLSSVKCQDNYLLHYILKRKFEDSLPHYVRAENYNKVKENIGKLIVVKGLVEDIQKDFAPFHCFNLSNIFEYMNEQIFEKIAHSLVSMAHETAKFAYWNLMVPRRLSAAAPSMYSLNEKESDYYSRIDKGFFYSRFLIEDRK